MMDMTFAFPMKFLLLWIVVTTLAIVALVLTLRMLERRHARRVQVFVDAKLAPRLLGGYHARIRRPLLWLTAIGFAAMALTFAQPHWGSAWLDVRKQSRDIMIVLDTSESMNATNPLPTRLERAKQKISALLEMAPGDRFGIVAYSGNAALQCPLTLDHGYVRAVLNAMNTNVVSEEGTNIAAALSEAVRVFEQEDRESGTSGKSARAILLISDGEQVSGDALAAAEKASEYARIYVIGIGNPEGSQIRMPEYMNRLSRSPNRESIHISKLDEEMLMRVAVGGNGVYARSRADRRDIEDIFNRFDALATRDIAGDIRLQTVNRFQWPLALAIACFAAEGVWIAAMPWWRRRSVRRYPVGDDADANV
jgi:Ca-activated chloride channel family protein